MVFAYINKSKSRKEGELNSQLFSLRVSERMKTIQVLLSIVSGTIVGFVLGLLGGYGSITE